VLRARSLLFALPAAAVVLITGCASHATSSPSRQSAPPASIPAAAPAGYACSTANVFTQAVGAPVRQEVTLGDTTAILTGTAASDGVEPSQLQGGLLDALLGRELGGIRRGCCSRNWLPPWHDAPLS